MHTENTLIKYLRTLAICVSFAFSISPAKASSGGDWFSAELIASDIMGLGQINAIDTKDSGAGTANLTGVVNFLSDGNDTYSRPVDVYMGVIDSSMAGLQSFVPSTEYPNYGALVRSWTPILKDYTLRVGPNYPLQGLWRRPLNSPRGLHIFFLVVVHSGDDSSDVRKWITNAARFIMVY